MAQAAIPGIGSHVLFYQAWNACKEESCTRPCAGSCGACRPNGWVVSRLLGLAAQESGRAIEDLAPAIRGVLEESCFVDDAGELVSEPEKRPPIQKQTDLVVLALERMRKAGLI